MSVLRHHAANDTEQQIQAARELLKPSEVRTSHVPDWFRKALIKAYGTRHHGTSGHEVISHAFKGADWLDHWGSTELDGQTVFVSEPYHLTRDEHVEVANVAEKIGCDCWISTNSWHYPGYTIRIAFAERVQP